DWIVSRMASLGGYRAESAGGGFEPQRARFALADVQRQRVGLTLPECGLEHLPDRGPVVVERRPDQHVGRATWTSMPIPSAGETRVRRENVTRRGTAAPSGHRRRGSMPRFVLPSLGGFGCFGFFGSLRGRSRLPMAISCSGLGTAACGSCRGDQRLVYRLRTPLGDPPRSIAPRDNAYLVRGASARIISVPRRGAGSPEPLPRSR